MNLTITAASSALFSTWVFVEELDLIFDAGDGLSAGLAQKGRKARHVFISHADRDHVAGLLQFHQLNARDGLPSIHYPKDCGSFWALRDFMEKFDPQSGPATWNPLSVGDEIQLEGGHSVVALASDHIDMSGSPDKALRFVVRHRRRVLREEHIGLPGPEIGRLRKEKGEEAVTEERIEDILGYSGDASRLDPDPWRGVQVLFHECTFLEPHIAKRAHSNLIQVLEGANGLSLKALVLFHFSTRYHNEEIVAAISREAERIALTCPVFAVLPGVISRNVLSEAPVWSPKP